MNRLKALWDFQILLLVSLIYIPHADELMMNLNVTMKVIHLLAALMRISNKVC